MLAGEKLDGLVASQPFNHHGRLIVPLYDAGIPIFTEKPLAGSIEVGERMLQAMASGGSWHMVGYNKRSDPATMDAKARIERLKSTGELGRLRYVRILMPPGDWVANGFDGMLSTDEPVPQSAPDPQPADMDAGSHKAYLTFVNYYIHQVNLIRHLLGERWRPTYADPSGILLVGRSDSGVTCTIEMAPYQTTMDWQESALVAFERGYVRLDLPAPLALNRSGRVELFADPGGGIPPQSTVPVLPPIHSMRRQAMNFISAIRGETAPMCTAQEAMEDLVIAREYLRLWKNV
jgi:predicted dehydrogenase